MARYYKKHRRRRKKRGKYIGRRKRKVSYKKGRQNVRRLVNQPFQLPRTFTGSTIAPTRQTAFNLTSVAASGTDMFAGSASASGYLYQLRPNDIAAPWIGLPSGTGTVVDLTGATNVQQPIQGLHAAAGPLTTAGYGRAACVALSMTLHIDYPKSSTAYNGTAMARINSNPIYIWVSMSSGNDASGLKSVPDTNDTLQELRLHEGVKLYKINPGTKRTLTMEIPSVHKYLKRTWYTSSGSDFNIVTADIGTWVNAKVQDVLSQNFQVGPPPQYEPFTDVEIYDKMRFVACNWGYWCPNTGEQMSVQTCEMNTTMTIRQKVRFYQARSMQDTEEKTVMP